MTQYLATHPIATILFALFIIGLIVAFIIANVIIGGKIADERNRIDREHQEEQDKYNEFIKNHKY